MNDPAAVLLAFPHTSTPPSKASAHHFPTLQTAGSGGGAHALIIENKPSHRAGRIHGDRSAASPDFFSPFVPSPNLIK
jgi:hypothetical protein